VTISFSRRALLHGVHFSALISSYSTESVPADSFIDGIISLYYIKQHAFHRIILSHNKKFGVSTEPTFKSLLLAQKKPKLQPRPTL